MLRVAQRQSSELQKDQSTIAFEQLLAFLVLGHGRRQLLKRQSSELQKDQSTRSRQRGCEGRSSMFAMVDLASVPCTSRLSTGRRRSRASEARRGYAAHPRAGSRSSFFG